MKKATIEKWTEIVSDFEESGLSVREYCSLHGLSITYFYSQRKKLHSLETEPEVLDNSADLPVEQPQSFIPVSVPATIEPAAVICTEQKHSLTINGNLLVFDSRIPPDLLESAVRGCRL